MFNFGRYAPVIWDGTSGTPFEVYDSNNVYTCSIFAESDNSAVHSHNAKIYTDDLYQSTGNNAIYINSNSIKADLNYLSQYISYVIIKY